MLCFNAVNEHLLQCLCAPQPMQLRGLCVLYCADILPCNTYGLSLLLKWFWALWTLVSNHPVSWPGESAGRSWRRDEEVKQECVMTLLKKENAQSKFNPSSYIETCLHVSVLILTSVLWKKPSIWMLKLSIHWVVYKARLHKISRWSVLIHHAIIFGVCGGLGLLSLSHPCQYSTENCWGSWKWWSGIMSFLVYKLTGQKGLHVHWNKVEYGF